ncbi:MAG: hypothetical protein QXS23_06800 [Desulfurococcaceae archaeon]
MNLALDPLIRYVFVEKVSACLSLIYCDEIIHWIDFCPDPSA